MKNSLVSLAKGSGAKKATPAPTKKPVVKVVEKPKLTKEEERDEKAKETVEKLLQGVELTPLKKEEVIVPEEEEVVKGEGVEWLEEQTATLAEQCELLKAELTEAKDNYSRLFQQMQKGGVATADVSLSDETYKQNILFMFNELQSNFLGMNPERNRYSIVNIDYMLKQFMTLFPFTEQYRRF